MLCQLYLNKKEKLWLRYMVSPKVRGRRKRELWIFFECVSRLVYQPQLSDFPPLYETSLIMPSDFLFSSRNLKITFQEKKKSITAFTDWVMMLPSQTHKQGVNILKQGLNLHPLGFARWVTPVSDSCECLTLSLQW